MSSVSRAGFAVTAIAAITAIVAPAAAQSNPYRQVEEPKPPAHMNGGEWARLDCTGSGFLDKSAA